ncbi:MAG: transcriptional repressor [candidate division WOR-3 bacterium]|nr:transcriptional repressor [candidate division WOR-3 bacterium]MDH5684546.1 transcriptional repressor [candidate division WOR-3 bacterium]
MIKHDDTKHKNSEEELQIFQKACKKHGLKITPQRIAIYQELKSSKQHPSAITIYRKIRNYFPNISLGTVNSTLLTFAGIGLTKVVESSGDPKRFDPDLKPHHHFKCQKCGKIIDFYNNKYDAIDVPPAIRKRFVVLNKIVQLEGLCDRCR